MPYDDGRMHVVHAGDSRCYLFRDNTIRQITDDHSWIAEQVRSGNLTEAEAKASRYRHVITRSVGFERDVEADSRTVACEAGDCFLLCSDGLSNYVENRELEHILATTWFRRAPQHLVDLANQRGGDDNVTVVAVMIANEQID
jgi:protein phosphatase